MPEPSHAPCCTSLARSPQDIKLPEKYRLVPAPRADQQVAAQDASVVQLSRAGRAAQIVLRDDMLTAVGCKGYRMVRATHGVREGSWYFEIKVASPLHGEDAHTRLGWSTEMGELQAPVGYDANSYSYRDIGGAKFHESAGAPYGEACAPPASRTAPPHPPHLPTAGGRRPAPRRAPPRPSAPAACSQMGRAT